MIYKVVKLGGVFCGEGLVCEVNIEITVATSSMSRTSMASSYEL